jgi:bifunctional DNA-binding transcriptional regulator/antitoxin component of YhaV-PrlF toxin-antitoxin module
MIDKNQTSMDSQGRIVIPSTFGNKLGLSRGMTLIVEEGENNEFCLRVQKDAPILVDKKGILVVKCESKIDLTKRGRRPQPKKSLTGHLPAHCGAPGYPSFT